MYVKIGRYLFFYFLQLYCPLECECHCYYPLSGMASYLESIVLRHLQLPHLRLSTAPTLPENTNDKNNGISLKVLLCNMFFTLCSKLGRYVKNTHIKVKLFSKPTHILQLFPTKKQASDQLNRKVNQSEAGFFLAGNSLKMNIDVIFEKSLTLVVHYPITYKFFCKKIRGIFENILVNTP